MAVPSDPKLNGFNVVQTPFKEIGDRDIQTHILIPQIPQTGVKSPAIVRFHGGGLVMGDSLDMGFWPHWLSDLALQNAAVIFSPNYRLLPEATSADIYADVEDFWIWLHSPAAANLLQARTSPIELNLNCIVTAGESAGGLLSIYLALAHPSQVCAAMVAYPWIDPSSESFASPRIHPPFGQHTPESVFHDKMKSTVLGSSISSRDQGESLTFLLSAIEHGRLAELYERGTKGVPREILYPMARLEQSNIKIPCGGIVILHGYQDSVVPLAEVEKFIMRAREVTKSLPGSEGLLLAVREGDHGFDSNLRLNDEWLQRALKNAINYWRERSNNSNTSAQLPLQT